MIGSDDSPSCAIRRRATAGFPSTASSDAGRYGSPSSAHSFRCSLMKKMGAYFSASCCSADRDCAPAGSGAANGPTTTSRSARTIGSAERHRRAIDCGSVFNCRHSTILAARNPRADARTVRCGSGPIVRDIRSTTDAERFVRRPVSSTRRTFDVAARIRCELYVEDTKKAPGISRD